MKLFGNRKSNARVGLDIGTRTIKLTQINSAPNGLQLLAMGYCATPVGAITDAMINNPEAVGEAIWQLVKYYGIKEKKVVCALPGRAITVRQVSFPAGLSEKEIKVAVIGEVERFLPFPIDEMEYDYRILGQYESGDAKLLSVLFIASHRDTVMKRVEAIRIAGLESVEIDVEIFVTLRAIVESGLLEDKETFSETILLLDMGASSSSISILKGGLLKFTRIFAAGGDILTKAIESGFDISFLEAEKLKKEKALAVIEDPSKISDPQMLEINELIKPHIENLALEVRRSIAYYTSKFRGETVAKVILTGGASLLRGINKFFEDEVGMSVAYGNPMANITYVGSEDITKISNIVPFMGPSIGLSLRQLSSKTLSNFCLNVDIDIHYEFGSNIQAGGVT